MVAEYVATNKSFGYDRVPSPVDWPAVDQLLHRSTSPRRSPPANSSRNVDDGAVTTKSKKKVVKKKTKVIIIPFLCN
jgi:hypothetical protein